MNDQSGDNKELLEFFNNMMDDDIEKEILKKILEKIINEEMIGDLLEIMENQYD